MSARRLVIHAGMHKTGSSSIQRALAGLEAPGFRYLDPGRGPNHSGALHAAFSSTPGAYHTFVRRRYTPAQVRDIGEAVRAALSGQLRASHDATCVLSGEGITRLDPDGLRALQAFAATHARQVDVLAYVRAPRSFMESAFQQRVKGGLASFNLQHLYPAYRQRFGPLEDAFGRAATTLLPYRRDRLRDGDVVADFCARIGVPRPAARVPELNRALSRRAVSLLYTYRKFGAGYGTGDAEIRANAALVEALAGLDGERLRFGGDDVASVLAQRRGDLQWVEARLGEALDEPPAEDGAVESEADLLRYDEAQLRWLAGWGADVPATGDATPGRVAAAMHAALPAIAEASRVGR